VEGVKLDKQGRRTDSVGSGGIKRDKVIDYSLQMDNLEGGAGSPRLTLTLMVSPTRSVTSLATYLEEEGPSTFGHVLKQHVALHIAYHHGQESQHEPKDVYETKLHLLGRP
jgi:hypothetical protein